MPRSVPPWWVEAFQQISALSPASIVALRVVAGGSPLIEWLNPSAAGLLGVARPEAALGRPIDDVYPLDAATDVARQLARAATAGEPIHYEAIREAPEGRRTLQVTVIPLDDGLFMLFKLDISAEREATRLLERVTRVAHMGFFHWNIPDARLTLSDELLRLFGDDTTMRTCTVPEFLDRVHPDDRERVAGFFSRSLQERRALSAQYRIVRRSDGEVRYIDGRGEAGLDEHGEMTNVVAIVQDVTDRHQLEQEAAQLQRALERRRTGLEIHDQVVQGLGVAWLALLSDDQPAALDAVRSTSEKARGLVTDLLAETIDASGGVRPGDLVHEGTVSDHMKPDEAHER